MNGASQGSIDVFYLTEKPIFYEGPFLKEERALIDTLSSIIGKSFENILKNDQIQAINQQLQAGEQQLQASNQQLRATNQQLQAGEQQLQASNQQLKATNQQLQASEQQLQKSLADTKFWADIVLDSNIGVVVGYPDGKFGVSNKTYQQITGYNDEELKAIDWNKVLTPPEWLESELQKLNELFETKKAVVYKKEYIRKDGKRVPVELTVHARLDEKGDISYYYSFVKDITERKKAENIKDLILNISNATYQTLNLEDLVLKIEQEISTVVNTKNIYFVLHDQEKNKLNMLLHKDEEDVFQGFPETGTLTHYLLKTGKPLLAKKNTFKELREAGETLKFGTDPQIWLGVPFSIKGRVMGAIVVQSYEDANAFNMDDLMVLKVVSDQIGISIERKIFEEKMIVAKFKAEESDRLKSAFLANMSHEIRTPMNGILGFTELLKEPNLSGEEQHRFIEIIKKSGDRMLNTVNDIIDISKIDSGQVEIVQTEVNINEEIETNYDFFNGEASVKGIELKLINDLPKQDVLILTDKVKLNSILSNLIKNAIKYTDKGSIKIYCREKDSMFEFKIKDTGIGIPEDRIESIFNRFEQADITDAHARQGSGLGLSIIKAFVKMLNGNIGVQSEFGKGSTFYFTLPWVEKQKKAVPEKDNRDLSKAFDKQINLLIAEDDDSSFEYLKAILDKVVNKIVRTTNGKETVSYLKNNTDINLVLMDVNMPELNGYDATKQIKKFRPELYNIAQTAYALLGDEEKALQSGCNDYISKPIKKELLLAKIEKSLLF